MLQFYLTWTQESSPSSPSQHAADVFARLGRIHVTSSSVSHSPTALRLFRHLVEEWWGGGVWFSLSSYDGREGDILSTHRTQDAEGWLNFWRWLTPDDASLECAAVCSDDPMPASSGVKSTLRLLPLPLSLLFLLAPSSMWHASSMNMQRAFRRTVATNSFLWRVTPPRWARN
jgi:hypothetical protein